MQTRYKALFHKWIVFLMVAGCGAFLAWETMSLFTSEQPYDHPAFMETELWKTGWQRHGITRAADTGSMSKSCFNIRLSLAHLFGILL